MTSPLKSLTEEEKLPIKKILRSSGLLYAQHLYEYGQWTNAIPFGTLKLNT